MSDNLEDVLNSMNMQYDQQVQSNLRDAEMEQQVDDEEDVVDMNYLLAGSPEADQSP